MGPMDRGEEGRMGCTSSSFSSPLCRATTTGFGLAVVVVVVLVVLVELACDLGWNPLSIANWCRTSLSKVPETSANSRYHFSRICRWKSGDGVGDPETRAEMEAIAIITTRKAIRLPDYQTSGCACVCCLLLLN